MDHTHKDSGAPRAPWGMPAWAWALAQTGAIGLICYCFVTVEDRLYSTQREVMQVLHQELKDARQANESREREQVQILAALVEQARETLRLARDTNDRLRKIARPFEGLRE